MINAPGQVIAVVPWAFTGVVFAATEELGGKVTVPALKVQESA
ncbi:hypothetical protein yfred0001_5200 [Yersinia frederiksenii ATCC 33641]|nr:hypothetical protein yfred0001_5200 [Yersinia frederiksenii ATCC 33641]